MPGSSLLARVPGAGVIYAIALAASVFLVCIATQFSCHLSPGENAVIAFALVALTFFATGVVVMGGVLVPAAMLLRRIRWLYWWSILPIAAATAVLPSAVLCISDSSCNQGGFAPVVGTLAFAGLCGGAYLWGTRLRHEASHPALTQRIAAQSPAVKVGLIFLGAYLAVLAAAVVWVAMQSHAEAGMILLYFALPWLNLKLFGDYGMGYGVLLAPVLNGVIAFGIGYAIARIFRRA